MKRAVLVRPNGPRNVGMVLRVCANFGPCELVLVAPERPALLRHPELEQMAHGVEHWREKLRVVATLPEALADCTATVGFTARVRDHFVRDAFGEALDELRAVANDPDERLALVFGNEIAGLSAEETALCQRLVHVRTAPEHTSLNLAICAGIVLQALFEAEAPREREPGGHPLTGEEREFLKANLKQVFAGRVARSPQAAADIVDSIERVFARAPLESRDARAWHMMARALGGGARPEDFGLDPSPSRRKGARE